MREAGDVVVALGVEEDLRLVLEAAEGLGMDDPIPVPLEGGAKWIRLFLSSSPAAGDRSSGWEAKALLFRLSNRAIAADETFCHGSMMTDPQLLALTRRLRRT
jgi:hypothetical protein